MTYRQTISVTVAALMASSAGFAHAQSAPTTLQDAINVAVNSHPEIAQAQYNKEAIEFERKQAQGLYAPRVDVEGSVGIRHLDNATRRLIGIQNDELYPVEGQAVADWLVLDFGRRRGELLRQAARVDGASLRVAERSEYVGLMVAREYLNVLLQERVVAASQDNVAFHQNMVNDLATGVKQGSISVADQQQAEERLQAAKVKVTEAEQSLSEAKIALRALTGLDIEGAQMPAPLTEQLPLTVDEAVGIVRTDNPKIREAQADVDAANALASSVHGDLFPKIGVEVTGRIGDDIDGFKGETKDVQARAYLRWNIFDGGINRANYQEKVRQASQARYRMYQLAREAEQDVRVAWSTMKTQARVVTDLSAQNKVSDDLVASYRAQFNVGRRSLLDLLDAQNTRFSVVVRLETARFSQMFAQYQVLGTENRFLKSLSLAPGAGAGANERSRFNYGPPVPAELQYRTTSK